MVEISDLTDNLKFCPSCGFDRHQHAKHVEQCPNTATEWDTYKPILYKDRLTDQWVVECQNCGFVALFGEGSHVTAYLWNKLPRKR